VAERCLLNRALETDYLRSQLGIRFPESIDLKLAATLKVPKHLLELLLSGPDLVVFVFEVTAELGRKLSDYHRSEYIPTERLEQQVP